MKGIDSEGMMISAEELALPAEWFEDGIMQLDPDTPLGANVAELFAINDDVLDVEITSNRVDAMAVIGLHANWPLRTACRCACRHSKIRRATRSDAAHGEHRVARLHTFCGATFRGCDRRTGTGLDAHSPGVVWSAPDQQPGRHFELRDV